MLAAWARWKRLLQSERRRLRGFIDPHVAHTVFVGASPTRAWTSTRSSISPPAKPWRRLAEPTAALIERDMRHASAPADVLREIPIPDLIKMVKKAADLYMRGRAAPGRRHSDARPVRSHAVGDDGPAGAHVPVQHEEEPLRARTDGQDPRQPDSRPRSRISCRAATASSPAACRSATRRRRRSLGWCCPAIRPACTRCGCRSFPCKSAWF